MYISPHPNYFSKVKTKRQAWRKSKTQWNALRRKTNICWKHNSTRNVERSKTPSTLMESTATNTDILCVKLFGEVSKFRGMSLETYLKQESIQSSQKLKPKVHPSSRRLSRRQLACPRCASRSHCICSRSIMIWNSLVYWCLSKR